MTAGVLWAFAAAVLLGTPLQRAQAQDAPAFSQAELDQMLAPIALYPDALLAQILMAATYPLEVVEAERWTVANPSVNGSAAVQAVDANNWDPSVKSLVAFPRILQALSAKLDWTQRLGDAFLGQQQQVMDTIQSLRQKAYAAGTLVSNAQDQVAVNGGAISIVPANPQIAYAPYYDPSVVYGPWWWPQYPPVYWAPWPGYAYVDGYGQGFLWGPGLVIGLDFLFGGFDWPAHHVNVDYAHWHGRPPQHAQPVGAGPAPWQHSAYHRQGLPYRRPPPLSILPAPPITPSARQAFRGFPRNSTPLVTPTPLANPAPRVAPVAPVVQPPRPHAFENIGQGQAVRDFSARGQSSVRPSSQWTPSPCPPGGCVSGESTGRSAPAGGRVNQRR